LFFVGLVMTLREFVVAQLATGGIILGFVDWAPLPGHSWAVAG
jgi:hypothetical protein